MNIAIFDFPSKIGLILLLSLFFLSCGSEEKKTWTEGISKQLAVFRKANFSDIAYDIHLDIPAQLAEEVKGSMTLSFRMKNDSMPLVLDFAEEAQKLLSIEHEGGDIPYRAENGHIVIDPGHLVVGDNRLHIEFIAGESSLNRHEEYLYSLFVPAQASKAFPCFDQPDIKASFSLRLTVPQAWKAISNGRLKEVIPQGERKVCVFEATLPIPTYLLAFTAGLFHRLDFERDGRKLSLYHRETDSLKLAQNVPEVFRLHKVALDWMESYTDKSMPFPDFKMILIPSFQFGGMEHPGAIYYKASSLLLSPTASEQQKLRRANLIAHETAHLWFGDLVTMSWFDDVWLKEVFANFMAAKIVNPSFPDIDHELNFLLSHYPQAYAIDRSEGRHPIQQALPNLEKAGSLYGDIIYHKAPIAMQHLESLMGPEALQEGLRDYLDHYAYGNATWIQLIDILNAHTSLDLTFWSKVWVEQSGFPRIDHLIVPHSDEATIRKMEVLQSSPDKGQVPFWPQQMQYGLMYAEELKAYPLVFSKKKTASVKGVIGQKLPKKVIPNSDGKGYGRFPLDSGTTRFLLDSINTLSPPVTRAALWMSLWEEAQEQNISTKQWILALEKAVLKEQNSILLEYILSKLTFCYWHWHSQKEREQLAPRLEGVLLNMMLHAPTPSLKNTFYKAFRNMVLTENGMDVLYRLWKGDFVIESFDLTEEDRITLAYELALRNPENGEVLRQQWQDVTNPDRKKRMAFVMKALDPKEENREAFFESLKEETHRKNETWVLEAIKYLHHPLHSARSEKYILPSLILLEEIEATGDIFFPKRWLDNTLYGHHSRTAAHTVTSFLADRKDYPLALRNKVLQSADLLLRSADRDYKKNEKKGTL